MKLARFPRTQISRYYTPTGLVETVRDNVALPKVSHDANLVCCVCCCFK
jgi:hypothetical protein